MMIQITNRCRMMCPHCMDDSRPDGGLMDEATFGNALKFVQAGGGMQVTISGGEPTEHPQFVDFCKRCSKAGIPFCICTNGMWLGAHETEWRFEKVAKLKNFMGAQVYSNPKWYRRHDETVKLYAEQEDRWKRLGVLLDTTDIRAMSDIGRAATCEAAIKESEDSLWHSTCLAAHVTAVQSGSLNQFMLMMIMQARFCSPMIDWRGDLHASESWLCQSFGNVNREDPDTLFNNLKKGRPCCKCIPGKRYLSDPSHKMVAARELLGQ